MRALSLAIIMISITITVSGCGDTATPAPGLEPASSYRLVVSPTRDRAERVEARLEDGDAAVAFRSVDGHIELRVLRVEESPTAGLSVTNDTGEEILLSLFYEDRLVFEGPLATGRTEFFGDIRSSGS